MKRFLAVSTLAALLATYSFARLTRAWTHDDLHKESDFVGLLEPVSNKPTADVFTIDVSGGGKVRYTGIDTRFRIAAIFKSDGKVDKELTVLHFSDEHTTVAVVNGPSFIYFPIGPLKYEKQVLKDKKVISKITVLQGEPLWLAFLKRRADGRYEPVSGQEDDDESFFEVHKPTHGAPP
jgi:hypothetical protein